MKTRLNITIEEPLLHDIKAYADEQKISISALVEKHFKTLIKKTKKESLLDIIDRMPKPKTNFPDDFDFKEEYYKQRAEKYGFKNDA